MPTIAASNRGEAAEDHRIDGENIWPLISGEPGAKSPHEAYYFYWGPRACRLSAWASWKLHFPHDYRTLSGRKGGTGGIPVNYDQSKIDLSLFDLENDIAESTDVKDKHPEVVTKMQQLADAMRADLGDGKNPGTGRREPGRLEEGDLRFHWEPGKPNETEAH